MRIDPAPNYWEITLTDGDVVRVLADAYSESDGAYVFKVLADADASEQEYLDITARTPSNPERVMVMVARFPVKAVAEIRTA